jgi:hypothetical protein
VPYTRSFDSFDAAAAEAGQSRIYGGIHYQFDNQAAQASGHAVGRFVVENFLRPAGEAYEADSRHDDRARGQGDFPAEALALLVAPGSASAGARSMPGKRPQRRQSHSTEGLTTTGLHKHHPIQHTGAPVRRVSRALEVRALDQTLAGREDSGLVEALQGDAVFASTR